MRILATLVISTFLAATAFSAHDGSAKKTGKADRSCCAEKSSDAKAVTKKDDSEACCDTQKVEMKEAQKMDCCKEHEKTSETKARSTNAQKDTK